jgi:hypothetical protein
MFAKRILSVLLSLSLFTFLPTSLASAAPKQGIYQLDFQPISTVLGTATLAESEAKAMVAKLNTAFQSITSGKFGMELRSILPTITTTSPIKNTGDMDQLIGATAKASAGYAGAIVIGYIPRDLNIVFAGQASGDSRILLNLPINESFQTLMHEIGHNLGLAHAGTAVCTLVAGSYNCKAIEYGDYSDFMGHYTYANPPSATVARTSAYNLDNLGVLDSSQITYVDTSTSLTLTPAYSNSVGTKIAYLPLLGQRAFAIEYRPAIGDDLQLMATQVPVPGTNSYYPNQPSYGVQIRFLAGLTDDYKAALPTITYSGFQDISKNSGFSGKMSNLLESFDGGRQGLDSGQSMTLFDGTVVSVTSADSIKSAQVSITRPVPTIATIFAPNAVSARWDYSPDPTYADSLKQEIIVPKSATAPLPTIRVEYKLPRTAIRLKSAQLLVNDAVVANSTEAELLHNNAGAPTILPTAAFTYSPTSLGTYKVAVRVTDAQGTTVESAPQTLISRNPYLKSYTDLCLVKKGWPENCTAYPVVQVSFCDTKAEQSIFIQSGTKWILAKKLVGVIKPAACTDGVNKYFYSYVGNYPSPVQNKAVYKTFGKGAKGKPDSVDYFTIVMRKGKR